jgi:hypothetical protein
LKTILDFRRLPGETTSGAWALQDIGDKKPLLLNEELGDLSKAEEERVLEGGESEVEDKSGENFGRLRLW